MGSPKSVRQKSSKLLTSKIDSQQSDSTLSNSILSNPTLSKPILSNPTLSKPILSNPTLSKPILSNSTLSKQCAAKVMETIPLVMRFIRADMRDRKATELSVPQFRTLAFLDRNPGASLVELSEHL